MESCKKSKRQKTFSESWTSTFSYERSSSESEKDDVTKFSWTEENEEENEYSNEVNTKSYDPEQHYVVSPDRYLCISSTFFKHPFCTKVLCTAFLDTTEL